MYEELKQHIIDCKKYHETIETKGSVNAENYKHGVMSVLNSLLMKMSEIEEKQVK